ncbi:MAG TPA: NAD(P)-dependent oxidoreductase [Acetobacteraceae bacterium]|nr:NAD(P)-dependent oxidoreductase [Acetobacteraceae bacterium]
MPHVLITGAAGALGGRLRHHMQALGWKLTLLDREPSGDGAIVEAELSRFSDDWAWRFAGVDTVLHLAGDPSPRASWASAQRNNIDATHHVVEAACRAGVRRVVFASSNWVLAGHRFESFPLDAGTEPYPVNPYGVSKLAGERIGCAASEMRGLSFIAFRIGYCQRDENRPGSHMGWGFWGQRMWLSNRDLCQGFEKAVLAPDTLRFGMFNLVSNNQGMRWRIDDVAAAIGYVPMDSSAPIETAEIAEETEAARDARHLIEITEALVIRRRW